MNYRVYVYAEDKSLVERKEFLKHTEAVEFVKTQQTNTFCMIFETDKQGKDYRIIYFKPNKGKASIRFELVLYLIISILICIIGYLNITFAKRQGYIAGYEAGKINTIREIISSELYPSYHSKIDDLLDKGVKQEGANDAK